MIGESHASKSRIRVAGAAGTVLSRHLSLTESSLAKVQRVGCPHAGEEGVRISRSILNSALSTPLDYYMHVCGCFR